MTFNSWRARPGAEIQSLVDSLEKTSPAASLVLDEEASQRLTMEYFRAYTEQELVFRRFYEAFKKPLGTFLYHLLANRQEVEDLYQEVFKKFWEHLQALPVLPPLNQEDARKWLFTVARHQVIDHYRKQKRLCTEPLEGVEQALSVSELLEDQICQQEQVQHLLAQMTPMYRICVVLQDLYAYSQQEIADFLGIQKKTVSSNVLRGRKQLLSALKTLRQHQEGKNI